MPDKPVCSALLHARPCGAHGPPAGWHCQGPSCIPLWPMTKSAAGALPPFRLRFVALAVSNTSRQRRPRPGGARSMAGSPKVMSVFCWPPRGSRRCGHKRSRSR